MNWRRGLLRVWVLVSVGWVAIVIYWFGEGCVYSPDSSIFNPLCATGKLAADGTPYAGLLRDFVFWDWARWIYRMLSVPVGLIGIGYLVIWVRHGFR
jgi:hypothetical protein